MKTITKPTAKNSSHVRTKFASADEIPDSACKKLRTSAQRKAAFDRLFAEFGPKPSERKRKDTGAVAFLIKQRRGEA